MSSKSSAHGQLGVKVTMPKIGGGVCKVRTTYVLSNHIYCVQSVSSFVERDSMKDFRSGWKTLRKDYGDNRFHLKSVRDSAL